MLTPQYITDNNGNKLSVVLPIKEYERLIADSEELEDIRLYDEGLLEKGEGIPADEAFKQIEAKRKNGNGL